MDWENSSKQNLIFITHRIRYNRVNTTEYVGICNDRVSLRIVFQMYWNFWLRYVYCDKWLHGMQQQQCIYIYLYIWYTYSMAAFATSFLFMYLFHRHHLVSPVLWSSLINKITTTTPLCSRTVVDWWNVYVYVIRFKNSVYDYCGSKLYID